MNKIFVSFLLTVLICLPAGILQATEQNQDVPSPRPSERFGRGMINIISSPLEIPAQMYRRALCKQEHVGNSFAVLGGFFEGIPMGLIYFPWRLYAGFYDIATFASPQSSKCLISPEYLNFSIGSLETNGH